MARYVGEHGEDVQRHTSMPELVVSPTNDVNMVLISVEGHSCTVNGVTLCEAVSEMLRRIRARR
jgi:hypothetical protein